MHWPFCWFFNFSKQTNKLEYNRISLFAIYPLCQNHDVSEKKFESIQMPNILNDHVDEAIICLVIIIQSEEHVLLEALRSLRHQLETLRSQLHLLKTLRLLKQLQLLLVFLSCLIKFTSGLIGDDCVFGVFWHALIFIWLSEKCFSLTACLGKFAQFWLKIILLINRL